MGIDIFIFNTACIIKDYDSQTPLHIKLWSESAVVIVCCTCGLPCPSFNWGKTGACSTIATVQCGQVDGDQFATISQLKTPFLFYFKA